MTTRGRHLNQKLRKRHGGRPVSIFTNTPHQKWQEFSSPSPQSSAGTSTWRPDPASTSKGCRGTRKWRQEATNAAKRQRLLQTQKQDNQNQDPLSQDISLSRLWLTEGAGNFCGRATAGRQGTTEGVDGVYRQANTIKIFSTFSRK